jgi:hypothetical protein
VSRFWMQEPLAERAKWTGPAWWGKDGKAGKEARGETERAADGESTVLALQKTSEGRMGAARSWRCRRPLGWDSPRSPCGAHPSQSLQTSASIPYRAGYRRSLALCSSASTATTARRANDTALLSDGAGPDGCTQAQREFIAVRACMCARVCVCAWCVYLCVRACVRACVIMCARACRGTCARSDSQKLTRARSVLRKAARHGDPTAWSSRPHGTPHQLKCMISHAPWSTPP